MGGSTAELHSASDVRRVKSQSDFCGAAPPSFVRLKIYVRKADLLFPADPTIIPGQTADIKDKSRPYERITSRKNIFISVDKTEKRM